MVSHGYNTQWHNKVIIVGGLNLDQGAAYNIELDVLTCQNSNCSWTSSGVSLAIPRLFGLAMVVPELMACQADTGVVDYTTPAGPLACNPGWIGDSFCDDINNHMDCSYDGGDCCGCNSKTGWCTECQCLDPNGLLTDAVSIGTNFCDDIYNNVDCSYDGGDCCGVNANTNYCTECQCLDPSGGCNTGWIGDNYCDDINNRMDCSYDGGDCCGCNVNTEWCTECQCLDPNGSGGETTCP